MRPTLPELVERAHALATGRRRVVIGIAGAPGAGKSTLAASLAAGTGGVVVPLDGFHKSNAELEAAGRREAKGAQDTFEAAEYVGLLKLLARTTRTAWAPDFDRAWERTVPGAIRIDGDVPLVITEGNYLLLEQGAWYGVRASLDAAWYLDLDDDVRVDRLVARGTGYGWTEQYARERATTGSDAVNAALVAGTRHRADLVITAP